MDSIFSFFIALLHLSIVQYVIVAIGIFALVAFIMYLMRG